MAALHDYATPITGPVAHHSDGLHFNPVVFFQPMDATETERRRQRNRIHVELLMPSDQLQTRVDAAVAAGGRMHRG